MAEMDFPKLMIMAGPDEGKEFGLPRDEMSRMGRAHDNAIMLADSSVSRRHAAIAPREGQFYLQDLESRNGTFWQGQKLASGGEQKLQHLDVIETGIYQFRFLEKPATPEELREPPQITPKTKPKPPAPNPTPATTPDKSKDEEEVEFLLDDILEEEKVKEEKKVIQKKQDRRNLTLVLSVVLLLLIAGTGYFYWTEKDSVTDFDITDAGLSDPKSPDQKPDVSVMSANPPATSPTTSTSEVQIFLDVKTKPLPATIYFKDKRLGITPLRETITIKPGESYDVYADFDLRDISDIYRKKLSFDARANTDVIELDVQAEIGLLKILKLPRNIEFYLEGHYEYDRSRARPVKISDIIYGKPVYLPFGRYRVELREWESISGSDNKISQIKFQREYVLNSENNRVDLSVTDRDLGEFPVVIKSDPSNAELVWEGKVLGSTPFTGKLPVGSNRMTVRKDGFFDKTLDVEMRFNSVFETRVTLETSKVGELINEAKKNLRADNKLAAINTLAEALKYGGGTAEKAQVYYLLGETYFGLNQFEQAMPYFEKARMHVDFARQAALGLAKVKNTLGDHRQALALTVEVLVNLDDKTPAAIRAEANAVFKKISPIKSVIYIHTEPKGADVFLNDKKLPEQSPVILSDLGLGSYRIDIEKAGYESYKTRQSLKLGEFALIKVKLRKLKF